MNVPRYIREVRQELTQVSWPNKQQAWDMTLVVLFASLIVGLYIGGLDYALSSALNLLLKR